MQSLSRDTSLPASTVGRYVELLEATFLITEIPAWSGGVDARITRSPKILITDCGLYGYLLNLAPRDRHIGFPIEEFVGTELLKLVSYQGIGDYTLLRFRTQQQQEVDFALESADRRIVGIEVKATSTASARDFRGLRVLSELACRRFHRGIVLYAGTDYVPFGPSMWADPISALWQ